MKALHSITGSHKAANWQQFVGEDGSVFFVELSRVTNVFLQGRNKETDTSSLCSYCSTRSTQSCTSEDTGYSSDAENQSSHSKQTTSSISKSFSTSSKFAPSVTSLPVFADFEDDDGVSVDVADYDEKNLCSCGQHPGGCPSSGDKLTSCLHNTCLGCMEQVECKSQKWIKEVIIRTGGHMWDGHPGVGWLQAVLGIVPEKPTHRVKMTRRRMQREVEINSLALVIGGKVVNIYCCKEGKDLLIVAAPADRVLTHQLKTLVKNVQRLLRCLFGSVELAFRSSQHHSAIDDFLGFLISFLSPSFKMGKYIRSRHAMYGYIAYLPLPGDIQMAISSTLTEFESAEFANMSETFYGCRRMFTILGSLVFYKGHALCSHLGQEDTVDIFFYLTHAGLLHLTARHRLHQLLVWQEIFPTRLCHDVTDTNSVFGYSEPYARWFLMVVGMKNLLLATLLEAGGCAAQIEGTCLPDPFYVDQARATALHLQSGDIISACERRLCGEGLPPTVKVDKLTSTHSTSTPVIRRFEHLIKSPTSISLNFGSNISSLPALSNNTLPAGCSLGNSPTRHEWRKISSESNVSVGNSNSGEQLFKAASGILGPHYPPAEYNLVPITCPPFVVDSDVNIFKLGSGKDNTVLIYCQLNRHESSLFSSSGSFNSDAPSSLQRQLVDNFWRCCAMIHADFVKSIHRKTNRGECLLSDFEADCTLSSCREQGVMFMITSHDTTDNRKPLSLAYWVVGRKLWYPQLREIFVCFHESTPQNIVELAFRLSAGNLELA
ncbi:hypothetical protein C0Q70_05889 [Pomacea canaliculata]|uniref:Protein inturned n=1 Tax=Pomacea canaliculata TaxID=400727 RepID=A0A2T7PMG9_POMCA|nr:hypothetical protein C0Q70_05889 [Pomacea canaliculata]